jgi:hypothetical protein
MILILWDTFFTIVVASTRQGQNRNEFALRESMLVPLRGKEAPCKHIAEYRGDNESSTMIFNWRDMPFTIVAASTRQGQNRNEFALGKSMLLTLRGGESHQISLPGVKVLKI